MDAKEQEYEDEYQRDAYQSDDWTSTIPYLKNITPLELRWRREWDAEKDAREKIESEYHRAIYLLKRIAGWVDFDPVPDVTVEARMFLEEYGHHPAEWGKQGKLL